jgi:hypothetical protein
MADFCGHGDEPSVSVADGEFLDSLVTINISVRVLPVWFSYLLSYIVNWRSRDSSALGYGLDDPGFDSRQGLGIFLLTTVSRPALGSIQHPSQWVQGVLSLGVKRSGREADNSSPSSAEVKSSTPPIRFHGVVLS